METFDEYLRERYPTGGVVNTLFKERLFRLSASLRRIVQAFETAVISYRLVGGMAVLVHIEEAAPEHTPLTGDVDLLVLETNVLQVGAVLAEAKLSAIYDAGKINVVGCPARVHIVGVDLLPPQVTKMVHKACVDVLPVADLVASKLSRYKLIDRVNVRALDTACLITPEVEQTLPPDLRERLQHVRDTE